MSKKLTVITAPGGYGKSTLLVGWKNTLEQEGAAVCWLSLDQEDSEPFQLLTYIAFALSEGGLDFNAAGIASDSLFKDATARNLLSMITHMIDIHGQKVVLILDDFENVAEDVIATVVQPLLEYAPENLHVAIATRDHSRLKVAGMEAQGQVNRLQANRMHFTAREISRIFDDQLDKQTLKRVVDYTEGWPVVVQLARGFLTQGHGTDLLFNGTASGSELITAYFSEQILSNTPLALQQFLMDISVVDRVSVEMADFLRDSQDSAARFLDCKALKALVFPVDSVDGAFRLHPLLRDYLRNELTTTAPARSLEIQLRAARWFARNGDFVKGVRHSMAARDPSLATDIIVNAGGITLWLKEGLARLREAINLFDPGYVQESPALAVIQCLIDVKDGRVFQARCNFDAMIRRYRKSRSQFSDSAAAQIDFEIALLEWMLAFYEGKVPSDAFCKQLEQNSARIEAADHSTRSYQYTVLCVAYTQRGRFEDARYYAEKATQEFKLFRSIYGELYINFHLGDICFAQGKSDEANEHYQTALRLTKKYFNDDKGIKLVANVLLAELKYELNQQDSIPFPVETIPSQLEEREAWFDIYAAGYITASNLEFQRYGLGAAELILDRACAYADAEKLNRLENLLLFQRINLYLLSGETERAESLLEASSISIEDYYNPQTSSVAWRECDMAVHAIARLLTMQKRFDAALEILSHFLDHARAHGHKRSCVRYEVLRAIAYQGRDCLNESTSSLLTAVELSAKSGFVRPFIDEGGEMVSLLSALKNDSSSVSARQREQIEAVLASFSGLVGEPTVEQLVSRRELEVLLQLSHGYSNKVIARQIDVSENTVRFHLKNIFAKLHVKNRLQAVSVAKERQII
ncbi:MAG: LuxR C-terminal-related transcriptional regulator [Pseudomonadota bacterium]